ncbi:MAG: hypothetical protein Q4G09_06100 [Clostridia bacterium]|nr:hypothetical protein [Clostridia bacterium]
MRKDAIKKIEEVIDQKKKLPTDIKNKIRKEIFINLIIAIIIITYFIFLMLGTNGKTKNVCIIDFNIFSLFSLGLAIYLFEKAYKRGNGKFAIYGIELLFVAIATLFLPYVIFEIDATYKKYYLMINSYIGIYYLIKSIYISIKRKKEYIKQISDIKDIIKKEKFKKDDKNNIDKIKSNNKKTSKTELSKKRGRPKKQDIVKPKENTINGSNMTEKRGRPKKQDKKQTEQNNNTSNIPKKRGRPKKEVVINHD